MKGMVNKSNNMKRIFTIFVVLLMSVGMIRAYNEHLTKWPTEGLMLHWDLHKDYLRDQVSGIVRDTTESHRFTGYNDTYIGNGKMIIPLPNDMWDVNRPHTILLRMVNYHDTDLEKFSLGLPIGLSADDDELEFVFFHNDQLKGAQTEYGLSLLWIPYSSSSTSSREAVIAVTIEMMNRSEPHKISSPRAPIRDASFYPARVGVAANEKYVIGFKGIYTGFNWSQTMELSCGEGWTIGSVESISFNEVAVYDRILSTEEIRQAIGSDKMSVETPEDYSPRFGWTILPYALFALLLFVLQIIYGNRVFTYISPSRLQHSPGVGDKEKAYKLVKEALACFGPQDAMKVPANPQLDYAEQCLNDAISNGYNDDEILGDYNRIASLINHCRQKKNGTSELFFWIIPFIIVFGVVITGYDYGTYLPIWTKQEMFPYYLSSLLSALIGLRLQGDKPGNAINTNEVKPLKPSLLGKFDDWLQKLGQVASGVTTSSVVSGFTAFWGFLAMFLYAIALALRVMLSCLYEFVVVVVSTGEVVASGIGGFTVGLVGGLAVFFLLLWLFMKLAWMLMNLFLWIVIPLLGVLAVFFIITGIVAFFKKRHLRIP